MLRVDVAMKSAHRPGRGRGRPTRRQVFARQAHALVGAIQAGDDTAVETAVLDLSRSRRIFAPLVFAVGAFVMLFQGLRLLFSYWRLTLIQVLPAMWIWLAFLDLEAHAFTGREVHAWDGAVDVLLVAVMRMVTSAAI